MRRDKKDDESGGGNPFSSLDRSSVLQEARVFHQTPINTRRCCEILTKILYLINKGENFTTNEATDTFFAMTKLFQCKDVVMRRMCYLTIKDMANMTENAFIVTQSLTKDMNGKEDMFRAAAVRALCAITDVSTLQGIERYMKQAIVDKVHSVSSAALVSSSHLASKAPDVVKRWANEAQEACMSDNVMVQYHALGLLYYLRKNDRLGTSKMVTKLMKGGLRSPFAYCLLIRIASKLLEEDDAGHDSPLFDFIESCLRNKNEIVIYEAASAIVNMPSCTARELAPAVSVLQLFLSSPKASFRYAGVRTLNKVAIKHPSAVIACNLDLENLITDVNRSIATLAITTLLKTGTESSVDRLMKQISSFMSEISEEFKVVVVQAISALCQKYPRQHSVMMNYLSSMLREGGFDYQKSIVDCIISIIEDSPDSKEVGLEHLCEFIEDCEHTILATKIINLLGAEGPATSNPSKYIRFIYNRIILENEAVRAAAVTALAKFGASSDDLLPSILTLLARSMLDEDDEVRDRATFFHTLLQQKDKKLNTTYISSGLIVPVPSLEQCLNQYTKELPDEPFSLKMVPLTTAPTKRDHEKKTTVNEKPKASRQEIYAEQLSRIKEFSVLGTLFKSSQPVELTEPETEYVISCVKHTFEKHMVFQFDCVNTLNDQVLEDVTVQVEPSDGFDVIAYVPCPILKYNEPGITYACASMPDDDDAEVTTSLGCTMKAIIKDCDPNTMEIDEEGYEENYQIEDIDVTVADHVQKILKSNFSAAWDELGNGCELEETYSLSSMKTLQAAVQNIIKYLGMQACERSDKVPEGKSSHTLYLSGIYRGGFEVLARAKLVLRDGVTMQLTVRSNGEIAAQVILSAVS